MLVKFNQIITKAIKYQATDIHLDFVDETCMIQFRVHGALIKYKDLSVHEGEQLFNFIKFHSGLSLSAHFKPQTSQISFQNQQKTLYLRISVIPSFKYESLVIRIMNNHAPLALIDLSYFKQPLIFFENLIRQTSGLYITTGPTGSGKTTTLYALLNAISTTKDVNIITIEDPIEIVVDRYTQLQINESSGIDFYSSLKQILRHDPDIIMIGEIRDELTAKIAIRSALTGHLVIATMHARDALSSINRLLELGVSLEDLKSTLIGVSYQQLLYTKTKHRPFCIYEIMTQTDLMNYFNKQDVHITTIKQYYEFSIKHQLIAETNLYGYNKE